MRVLVTGATGLIGGAVVDALLARGHVPVPAVRDVAAAKRRWPALEPVLVDFVRDTDPAVWRPRLAGIDAVVNAVGAFRDSAAQPLDALHDRTPRALFDACVDAGVQRVVQVSALGADDDAASRYHRSKRAADRHLLALPLAASIVRPSLVFASTGASSRLFLTLAALPLIALPDGGRQCIAPVHLGDVVDGIVHLLDMDAPPAVVDAVGESTMLRDYLATLRRSLGFGGAWAVSVPTRFAVAFARIAQRIPGSLVDPEALAMLARGNCASDKGFTSLLGHAPRAASNFVDESGIAVTRRDAQLRWNLPLLRVSIALVFVVTALLTFGLYPIGDSRALLAATGLTGTIADIALYAGGVLDLAIGVALLVPRTRRAACIAGIALITGYTLIITLALPGFWRQPFGPILKNLPILAGLLMLQTLDRRE